MLTDIEPRPGARIDETCRELIVLAILRKEATFALFNDTLIEVRPEDIDALMDRIRGRWLRKREGHAVRPPADPGT